MTIQVSKKIKGSGKYLPIIQCDCGAKIRLLPDVKVMSEGLEAHVALHKQKIKNLNLAEAERIRDDRIIQVLDKASKA